MFLGAAACCVVLFPAVGFLYRIDELHQRAHVTAIAWPTVVALLSLGLGLSVARASDGRVPLVWRDDPGGVLLRRMLPPAVLLPIVINFARLEGERSGLYERPVGAGFYAVSIVVVFLLVLWRSAIRLSAEAAERDRAQQQASWRARLIDLAHDAIFVWSPEHGIESWNRGAEDLYGYTASEALGRRSHDLLGTVFPRPLPEIEAELSRIGRWNGELLHRTKAGEQRMVSAKLQVVRARTAASGSSRPSVTSPRSGAPSISSPRRRRA